MAHSILRYLTPRQSGIKISNLGQAEKLYDINNHFQEMLWLEVNSYIIASLIRASSLMFKNKPLTILWCKVSKLFKIHFWHFIYNSKGHRYCLMDRCFFTININCTVWLLWHCSHPLNLAIYLKLESAPCSRSDHMFLSTIHIVNWSLTKEEKQTRGTSRISQLEHLVNRTTFSQGLLVLLNWTQLLLTDVIYSRAPGPNTALWSEKCPHLPFRPTYLQCAAMSSEKHERWMKNVL